MITQIRYNTAQNQATSFKRQLTKDEMSGLECNCEKSLINIGQAIGQKEIRAKDGIIEQLSPLRSSYVRAIQRQLKNPENITRQRKELNSYELMGLVSRSIECEGNRLAKIAIDLGQKKISPKRALAQVKELEARTVKAQFTPLPALREHLEAMLKAPTKRRMIAFATKSMNSLQRLLKG